MSTWWQKLVSILSGSESDPYSSGDTRSDDSGPANDDARFEAERGASPLSAPSPRLSVSEELAMHSTQAALETRREMQEMVGALRDLIESLERKLDVQPDRATYDRLDQKIDRLLERAPQGSQEGRTEERLDQLTARIEALASQTRQTHNGPIAQLLEKAEAGAEKAQQLREIVALLPDIATTQAEAIHNLDERLHSFEQRADASAERIATDLGEFKDIAGRLDQGLHGCHDSDAKIAELQARIVKSLTVLREALTKVIQADAAQSAKLQEMGAGREELRAHVTKECSRIAGKGTTTAIAFSVIAALAAIAAAVGVFLK